MYVVNNDAIFIAAYSGALAGMNVNGAPRPSVAASYDPFAAIAGAFAQAFDTAWGAAANTQLDADLATSMSQQYWSERQALSTDPAKYGAIAAQIIAEITSAENYFTAQGISPNPPSPPLTPGNLNEIQFVLGLATRSSATNVPANAIVNFCSLVVILGYSGGTTIAVGRAGSASLLMATADNVATVANEYQTPQTTAWGGAALPILATVAGGPAAGAALVTVKYSIPSP